MRLQCALEAVFPIVPGQLLRRGYCGRPFHEMMLEYGYPDFQTVRHACSVHFRQNISGEVSLEIHVLRKLERVCGFRSGRVVPEHLECPVSLQFGPEISGKHPLSE